jgi:hypothetical protein
VTTVVFLVLYFTSRDPFFVTPSTFLAKIYSNALLVLLNSRIRIVGGRDSQTDGQANVRASRGTVALSGGAGIAAWGGEQLGAVYVREEVFVHTDVSKMTGKVCCPSFMRNACL